MTLTGTTTEEFQALERLRSRTRHNETSALGHARQQEAEKWQGIVADKDAALANKDAALADKDAEIAVLKAQLGRQGT